MNTYRFRATPRYTSAIAFQALPALTIQAVTQMLTGAIVHELNGESTSGYVVEVQLSRSSHQDALDDIRVAMEQLGFNVAQAVVTEWLTSTLELALPGGASGGVVGSSTRDPAAIAAGALIGLVAGVVAARFMRTVKARFDAQLLHPYGRGWHITPQPPPRFPPAWGQAPY